MRDEFLKLAKARYAVIGLCLLIGGCAGEHVDEAKQTAIPSIEQTDAAQEASDLLLEDADAEDFWQATDDFDGDTFEEVSREELDELSAFVRRADAYGFLLSEYSSPEEVSLGQVFYMGAGLSEEPTPAEIEDYLEASGREEVYTTCVKLDADRVYDLLRKRLDCDPRELDLNAVGVFLPEHNAFFSEEADVNYVGYECISAIRNQGGGYELLLQTDDALCPEGYSHLRTMLLKDGEEYRFIFNECIGDEEADAGNLLSDDDEEADPEELWDHLKAEKFAVYEPVEYRYGVDAVFSVVLSLGDRAFAEGGEEMPYEEIVSYEGHDEDGHQFWWHEVYYDGDEVFGTKTRGWYWVDEATGVVTGTP